MANYPEELTDLLQDFLKDSKISQEEKEVLLKKARMKQMQFEMQQMQQEQMQQMQQQQAMLQQQMLQQQLVQQYAPKSEATKQCPACGEILDANAGFCAECGHLF